MKSSRAYFFTILHPLNTNPRVQRFFKQERNAGNWARARKPCDYTKHVRVELCMLQRESLSRLSGIKGPFYSRHERWKPELFKVKVSWFQLHAHEALWVPLTWPSAPFVCFLTRTCACQLHIFHERQSTNQIEARLPATMIECNS